VPGTVSTLVLVAQDTPPTAGTPHGKGPHDKELHGFAHAWSKQQFGCAAPGCVVAFTSYQEFLTKLKSFGHIDRLAILSHAAKNGLNFPAGINALTPRTLEEIVDDLDTDVPTVNSVEFLGCLVGRHVTGLLKVGEALESQVVIAYTFAHAFEPFTVQIEPGDTEADVEERIPEDRSRYLLKNTDIGVLLTDPKAQLWIEWYRAFLETDEESTFKAFEQASEIEHRKSFFRRIDANTLQVLSEQEAEDLEDLWSKLLIPPFTRVEMLP
jgi:hypothetical protein